MPRPDVSEERRPQIIAAATRIFARQGYHKSTMQDIAREAGLSIGGVYWYFKSKDQIVAAILERLFQEDMEVLRTLLDTRAPAGERLRSFASGYIETYSRFAWLDAIGLEFYVEAAHDAGLRELFQTSLTRYRHALVALIEQGIRQGEFRDVNPSDAANAILSLEEGITLLLSIDPNIRWQNTFQTGIELILAGLARPTESR
jgi:AcrR family transcriptional regulator